MLSLVLLGGGSVLASTVFHEWVGIGTETPVMMLDVVGGVKMSNDTDACNSTKEGTIRYNISSNVLEGCNGLIWNQLMLGDDVPDNFTFTDQSDVATSTVITSNIIAISGINTAASVSISGDGTPNFRICSDSSCNTVLSDWGTSADIENGKYLQLRLTSAATLPTAYTATVSISTQSDAWVVTTGDSDPDSFDFSDNTAVATNTLITSSIVQITGISGATVSISGSGTPNFRICSDASCSSVIHTWGSANQSISNNQYLQLRLTSNASAATTSTATVTVGSGSDSWGVTTAAVGYVFTPNCSGSCDNMILVQATTSHSIGGTDYNDAWNNLNTLCQIYGAQGPTTSDSGASGLWYNGSNSSYPITSDQWNPTNPWMTGNFLDAFPGGRIWIASGSPNWLSKATYPAVAIGNNLYTNQGSIVWESYHPQSGGNWETITSGTVNAGEYIMCAE